MEQKQRKSKFETYQVVIRKDQEARRLGPSGQIMAGSVEQLPRDMSGRQEKLNRSSIQKRAFV